jgi:hypothetical protein
VLQQVFQHLCSSQEGGSVLRCQASFIFPVDVSSILDQEIRNIDTSVGCCSV